MAFLRIDADEIPNLPSLLEARFPNNSTLLYNRVQFYLQGQVQAEVDESESTEENEGKIRQTENEDITFHWYSAFPPSTTAIASNYRKNGKSNWILVAPECETGHELDFVAVSFSIIVNWAEDNCFNGVEEKLYFPLKDLCPPENSEESKIYHPVYWITIEEALNLSQDLPNANLSLRKLTAEDVYIVLRHWKYGTVEDANFILEGILRMGSGALVLNGRPISWGVCLPNGAIHAVYTVPDQRGRGYAKILVRYLSKNLALQGYVPVAQAETTNAISRALFISVGFKFSHRYGWISVKGKEEPRPPSSQEDEVSQSSQQFQLDD